METQIVDWIFSMLLCEHTSMDDFYLAFENRHRGSREIIRQRLTVYRPFVEPLLEHYPSGQSLDLGCGRGEWLEMMLECGFAARGVDHDEGMLSACRDRELCVENQDALAAVRDAPDSSQVVISALHVVEHMNFEQVRELIAQSLRALVPGGLLILETPNPENMVVGACNFYLDPTHRKPIPPQLLEFAVEHAGFHHTKIIRLQEAEALRHEEQVVDLMTVLEGVSPDYAAIGQKKGAREILQSSSDVFQQQFGLELATLADRHTRQSSTRIQQAEDRAKQAEAKAQQAIKKANHAEALSNTTINQVNAVYSSTSWRITQPIRWAGAIKPLTKALLQRTALHVDKQPRLKRLIVPVVKCFPSLAERLHRIHSTENTQQPVPTEPAQLGARARQIHTAIEHHRQKKN